MKRKPPGGGPDSGPTGSFSRLRGLFRPSRLLSTSILSNFFWSVLNLGLGKGLRFAGILLCVRQMGTESWGQVAATLALLTLIGLFVSQGLGGLPQIFRVHERDMDRPLLRNISLYRLAMAGLVIAALFALHQVIPAVNSLVLLYSLILIPRALNLEWLFHRRERYHLALAVNAVKALAFFSLVAWNIGPESTAHSVVLLDIAAETAGLLFSLTLLKRAGLHGSTRGGSLSLAVLLAAALPVFLSEALHVLPVTVDVLFLKAYWGYEAVAQYDIGARIGLTYFFVGGALIQIVLPKLSRLHGTGDTVQMGRVLSTSSGILLVLGALLLLPSFYFAPEITRLLFDKDYPATIFVFQWMPVWVYVSFATMLNTIVLLSVGRRRDYFYGALIATTVNVLGNWILIAHFSVTGAVVARILAEAVFCAYAIARLPAGIKQGYKREITAQAGLLATLLLLFWASDHVSRPLCLGVSVVVCAVVFWRRGVFSRETLRVLRSN